VGGGVVGEGRVRGVCGGFLVRSGRRWAEGDGKGEYCFSSLVK